MSICIAQTRSDAQTFANMVNESPNAQVALHKAGQLWDLFPNFAQDIFAMLHNGLGAASIQPQGRRYATYEKMLREVAETEQFAQIAPYCKHDAVSAIITTTGLINQFADTVNNVALEALQHEEELQRGLDGNDAVLQTMKELLAETDPQKRAELLAELNALLPPELRHPHPTMAEAQATRDHIATDVLDAQEAAQNQAASFRQEARNGLKAAAKQTLGASASGALLSQCLDTPFAGQGGGRTNMTTVLAQRDRLAKPKIAKILEIFGRLSPIAANKRANMTRRMKTQLHGVEQGRNVHHQLPTETLMMAMPETEAIWTQRLCESRLMQYELTGEEKLGQGPIIFVIDSSGSMSTVEGECTRDEWAKAIIMCWLTLARKEKRDVRCYFFSSHGQIQRFDFPFHTKPETVDTFRERLLDACEFFWGRGTDLDGAVWKALADLKAETATRGAFAKADVVIVSDGDAYFNDPMAVVREREALNCNVYSILIGRDQGCEDQLAAVSNKVIPLRSVVECEAALDTVFTIE